ncbi:MAG: glycosyltransferase family 4 protein [Chloroflexota bacterium]
MRILVIIHEYPPLGGGGGHVARDICRGLAKLGHEVHVLTAHFKGLPYQEDAGGLQIERLASARQSPFRAGLLTMSGFIAASTLAGWRHVRAWRPDILHVHFAVPSGPVALFLSRIYQIPYVLTAHLGDVPGGVPEKTGRWFRWIYPFTPPIWKSAAQVVAVSEYTRQLALHNYPVDIQVIHNGVELEYLEPSQLEVGKPPRIAFAGRFMPQKNPLQLVDTLAELQHLEWECVLIGDGPLRPDIEQKIHQHALEGRFTLPGWVAPEEVDAWFARSDILFMPSLSEGLPVTGTQALAKGLAIVASRVGGFIDLVDQGENGYLIDLDDPAGFTTALTVLLSNRQRLQTFRQASLSKAHNFNIENISRAYEALFFQIIGKRQKTA